MKEARQPQKTYPQAPRRADRRAAAVIAEYIHELTPTGRRLPALPTSDMGRSS